jgi:hypothetical protein
MRGVYKGVHGSSGSSSVHQGTKEWEQVTSKRYPGTMLKLGLTFMRESRHSKHERKFENEGMDTSVKDKGTLS